MSPCPYLRPHPHGATLAVKVQPRAASNAIAGIAGDELRIRVTAPPVDAAANECLLEFLAARLGCARRQLVILRGQVSRHKVLLVRGQTVVDVQRQLGGGTPS